jgi:hypothetical protein
MTSGILRYGVFESVWIEDRELWDKSCPRKERDRSRLRCKRFAAFNGLQRTMEHGGLCGFVMLQEDS